MLNNYSEKWTVSGRDWVDDWRYREFKEYPPADASDKEILAFVKDAKVAEKMIEREMIMDGSTPEEAYKASCQFPLKEDAPMEAIREFIKYMRSIQDCEEDGIYP